MEALHALMLKNTVEKVKKSDISGFLQQTFLGSKTQQMETYSRSELTEQICVSEVREIQNEDTREHKDFLADRQLKALLFGLSKFHRLPVQPKGGQGQTHSRMLADLKLENSEAYLRPYLVGPSQVEAHVPDDSYPIDNYRETSPPKSAPYEADSVAPENSLEDPRILGKGDPEPKISLSTSKMVGSRSQCPPRSATTPTQPCSSHLYRCLKRRLGL